MQRRTFKWSVSTGLLAAAGLSFTGFGTRAAAANRETRWSYDDLRSDSFVCRAEVSSDGGRSWKLQSEYHMSRRYEAQK